MDPKNTEFKKGITGNNAAAYAALLARAQFISAYPITPQTTIVEYLASMAKDRDDVIFKPVESEHSAMAACIGASAAGLRVFTATSSHGLALMHEMLHWASGSRLPIVMANVNRAMAAPWNIHTDLTDSLSQRDTGWIQIYCSSNQEVLDTIIQAFALAETVHLPVMVCLDGFLLSHTFEPVDIPSQEKVDEFLPKRKPVFKLDINEPCTFGALHLPEHYMELRKDIENASIAAITAIKEINLEFSKIFDRSYQIVEKYHSEEAKTLFITNATTVYAAQTTVDELRNEGKKIGLINLRMVRPFPTTDLLSAIGNAKEIIVIDRSFTSNQGGILCQEIKSSLYPKNAEQYAKPAGIYGCIMGLGGRDITTAAIKNIFYSLKENRLKSMNWIGVKDE